MKPDAIKWVLGKDRYGRDVTLEFKDSYYSIVTEPYSQRDEGWRIHDLTKALILTAAECIKDCKP